MGNVFSFYQFPSTGLQGCFTWSGDPPSRFCVWEGPILPTTSPHFTDFTGFYVPLSVIEGRRVGFLWRLYDDFEALSPHYRVRVSGEPGNRLNENCYLSLIASGAFSTLVTDSGSYTVTFSGEQASGMYQTATFSTLYTGELVSGLKDQPTFSTVMSGDYVIANKDLTLFTTSFSAFLLPPDNERLNYDTRFSGKFSKKDKDVISLQCSLSGVSYVIGGKKVTISGEDEMNLTFGLSQVIFDFR